MVRLWQRNLYMPAAELVQLHSAQANLVAKAEHSVLAPHCCAVLLLPAAVLYPAVACAAVAAGRTVRGMLTVVCAGWVGVRTLSLVDQLGTWTRAWLFLSMGFVLGLTYLQWWATTQGEEQGG